MKQHHHQLMNHAKKKKKKKKSRSASNPPSLTPNQNEHHQQRLEVDEDTQSAVSSLMETFDSVSLQEASSAYKESNADLNHAADILANLLLADNSEDPSTSESGSGSTGGSEGLDLVRGKSGKKGKKVVAVTGTVSAVLGKEYIKGTPRKDWGVKEEKKRFGVGTEEKEEAEQFLCSMLGDESELDMAVVRDVLCQCGYNVKKAMDALLMLSGSSHEHSSDTIYFENAINYKEDTRFITEHGDRTTDKSSDCTSHSSESEFHDSIWGYDCRNYSQVLASFEAPSQTNWRSNESDLPQKVLESLFNISKSTEHEPSTMNWRNVVKKIQTLGPRLDFCPSSTAVPKQDLNAKGDEYHLFRESAKQHWDSMRSNFQKATVAYSKGQREYAAYLSDQGKIQTKLAREADEKASQDIFVARNKSIENVLTIDLHGQHVEQAMKLLKIHLIFGTYVRSIQILRVITGCGRHGVGKSKLKQSVIKLLENEGMKWREENQGTVLIELDGYKEYSFLDSDTDIG